MLGSSTGSRLGNLDRCDVEDTGTVGRGMGGDRILGRQKESGRMRLCLLWNVLLVSERRGVVIDLHEGVLTSVEGSRQSPGTACDAHARGNKRKEVFDPVCAGD